MNYSKTVLLRSVLCKSVHFLIYCTFYDSIGLSQFFVVKSRPHTNRLSMFFYVVNGVLYDYFNAVQKFLFFTILHLVGLTKMPKNVSITSKMKIYHKNIA